MAFFNPGEFHQCWEIHFFFPDFDNEDRMLRGYSFFLSAKLDTDYENISFMTHSQIKWDISGLKKMKNGSNF